MTIDIHDLIEQRPHLKDPLQLYEKWQRFHQEVTQYLPKERQSLPADESKAYPRKSSQAIFTLFTDIFELPAEEFAPLGQALAECKVDFMRLPLGEVPELPGLPCPEDDLFRILFRLARPYLQELRSKSSLDGRHWDNGSCPLCSAPAVLATIVEGPKRHLHCSYCTTFGTYRFTGCPNCGCTDSTHLTTMESEDEPGCRVITCDSCHTYIKVIEPPLLKKMGMDLADLATLPMDVVAQDKGFSRAAPNPISLKRME